MSHDEMNNIYMQFWHMYLPALPFRRCWEVVLPLLRRRGPHGRRLIVRLLHRHLRIISSLALAGNAAAAAAAAWLVDILLTSDNRVEPRHHLLLGRRPRQ